MTQNAEPFYSSTVKRRQIQRCVIQNLLYIPDSNYNLRIEQQVK